MPEVDVLVSGVENHGLKKTEQGPGHLRWGAVGSKDTRNWTHVKDWWDVSPSPNNPKSLHRFEVGGQLIVTLKDERQPGVPRSTGSAFFTKDVLYK